MSNKTVVGLKGLFTKPTDSVASIAFSLIRKRKKKITLSLDGLESTLDESIAKLREVHASLHKSLIEKAKLKEQELRSQRGS